MKAHENSWGTVLCTRVGAQPPSQAARRKDCLTGTEHNAWIEFVGSNPLPRRTNGDAQGGSPARDSLPLAPLPRGLPHAATARAGLLRNRVARKPFENSSQAGKSAARGRLLGAALRSTSRLEHLTLPCVLQAGQSTARGRLLGTALRSTLRRRSERHRVRPATMQRSAPRGMQPAGGAPRSRGPRRRGRR